MVRGLLDRAGAVPDPGLEEDGEDGGDADPEAGGA
jgi:hypothetical protein